MPVARHRGQRAPVELRRHRLHEVRPDSGMALDHVGQPRQHDPADDAPGQRLRPEGDGALHPAGVVALVGLGQRAVRAVARVDVDAVEAALRVGGDEVQELPAAAVHLGQRARLHGHRLVLPGGSPEGRQVDVGAARERDRHRRGPTPALTTAAEAHVARASGRSWSATPARSGWSRSSSIRRRLGVLQTEAGPAVGHHLAPQVAAGGGQQGIAGMALAAGQGLQLAQLLERVDADLLVGADRQAHARVAVLQSRQVAVAEVALGGRAGDDERLRLGEPRDVGVVDPDRVHDARARAEEAGALQQLDRRAAVLGVDLGQLAPLLGGVDVAHEAVLVAVAGDRRSASRPARPGPNARPPPRSRGRAPRPTPAARPRAPGTPRPTGRRSAADPRWAVAPARRGDRRPGAA